MQRLSFVFLAIVLLACTKPLRDDSTPPTNPSTYVFAKGADISWLTEMEANGKLFYSSTGTQTECMQLMKNIGFNSIRLRVWVNPTAGYNNTADVVAKAVRAKNLGMRILIDFHYSDSWADPGQQTKPAAWASQNITGLQSSVASHTTSVLQALQAAGVTPEWVQIGNETNDGMLWPEGKASTNMANFASLIKAGYNAVKAINNNIKVVVHISNGYDNSLFRWLFDGLKNNGANWDVIGMSLYPTPTNWQIINLQCQNNMTDMISRYNKPILIAEVGMSWDQPIACQLFLADIIAKTKALPNDMGLGVMYWEPQAYGSWKGYTLGAFDNSGRPTAALDAFK
jgi:arabinogalactan endo-1,4-beta-galactosidase